MIWDLLQLLAAISGILGWVLYWRALGEIEWTRHHYNRSQSQRESDMLNLLHISDSERHYAVMDRASMEERLNALHHERQYLLDKMCEYYRETREGATSDEKS